MGFLSVLSLGLNRPSEMSAVSGYSEETADASDYPTLALN